MNSDLERSIRHLDSILDWYEESGMNRVSYNPYDVEGLPSMGHFQGLMARGIRAIEIISGHDSVYTQMARETDIVGVMQIVEGLRRELEIGPLTPLKDILHAEIFEDYLKMAEHLLEMGYKDPAAVLVSGTLESHLKQLCLKNSIEIEYEHPQKGLQPRGSSQLNQDLCNGKVYSLYIQKKVTAWLDLRNKAAHGQYSYYTADEVREMMGGVKNFIEQNPA